MNKFTTQLFLLATFIMSASISYSQSYEIRTFENDMGYIEVQMRETTGGEALPETTDDINDITFAIRWPTSYSADIDFLCSTQQYNMFDPAGIRLTEGSYHYRYYNASPAPFDCPENWLVNTWVVITTFKVTSGSGTNGTFEIAPQYFGISTLNWQILEDGVPPVNQYLPIINGNVTGYSYPTVIYDLVWTGNGTDNGFQNEHSWNLAANWQDECGGGGATPTATSNCYIPSGITNYPENINKGFVVGAGNANNVKIQSGGSISFGTQANQGESLSLLGELHINGVFTINPDAGVTVVGTTYIDAIECLIIAADENGVGSFIDNGTIAYGGSGTAKVQTFITNSAGVGNFDIHQVGPTVDEENYTGSGTGAFLGAFDIVTLDTWVYKWDESADLVNGWANIHLVTDEIHSGEGVGISTTDNSNHTLEMTGELITGNVTNALTYSNNHYELISNPYPSSVDFDALATANSSFVLNKYWIYDPAANNYVTRAVGVGGAQYVQVGQGIFVETSQAGTFTFSNAQRSHSNDPFRSTVANMLTVNVIGGLSTYKDEMVVRFEQDATNGYDVEIESIKWNSMNDDATMIRSIIEDGTELAINVLPMQALQPGTMTSVPMNFNCGYNTEYTLSFFDMESFETGTEIWLEDKQVGGEWTSINNDPDYTFAANTNEPTDRFIIHFFGPTSVDEYGIENTIDIYSYRQYATVHNNTNEIIKDIVVYSLRGELIKKIEHSNLRLNKFWVADDVGYYVVRVITNKNVYTNKIFITK